MDRKVTALVVALLCVLAVSLAAATLVNPQDPAQTEGEVQPSDGDGTGDSDVDGPTQGDGRSDQEQTGGGNPLGLTGLCIPFLLSPLFIGLVIAAIIAAAILLKRKHDLVFAFGVLFPSVLFFVPIWAFFTTCRQRLSGQRSGFQVAVKKQINESLSPGGSVNAATNDVLSPSVLFAAFVVLAVVVVLVAYRASGDDVVQEDDEPVPEPDEPEDDQALAAVGAAAGEAADRIDQTSDVENEVYRAWREMTDHLNVRNPRASTPREFADAARDAGMDTAHVDRLTEVFRDVRYGGRAATEDREREAVDALRAIEDAYAEGGEE